MITLIRCDDRLIHGQCMVRVINDFSIQHIIIVDDFTAGNPVLKTVFISAAPPNVAVEVIRAAGAEQMIEPHVADAVPTLVLMRSPDVAIALFKKIPQLKRELDIGPMSNRPHTTRVTDYAYLRDEELAALETLEAAGVRIYFNQIITQKTFEWSELKKNIV